MRLRLLAFALLGAAACSDAATSSGDDELQKDASVDHASVGDAGADVEADAPKTPLPSCLGDVRSLTSATSPHTSVAVGAAPSPYVGSFLVDYATTRSTIDLSSFTAPGPTATNCNAGACSFADLDFFGSWGPVTLVTSGSNILGTDFLAQNVYTLDYAAKRILKATRASACGDAALMTAGLAPLSTAGFFAHDLSTLKPAHDVDDQAPAGQSVANVPTVPVRIAGAAAIAQLDTGFDDTLVLHSINVNVAFFDAIDPTALVRDASADLALSTCAGVAEPVEAYRLAAGRSFELDGVDGGAARSWTSATVFVKRTPAAARKCGGIGTWSTPAAQIGTSFYAEIGVLVFDPFASRVWIAR